MKSSNTKMSVKSVMKNLTGNGNKGKKTVVVGKKKVAPSTKKGVKVSFGARMASLRKNKAMGKTTAKKA